MDLLYRIPVGLIRVYGRMVERLQAQESLREAERISVGTGSLRRSDARDIRRRWQREAGMDDRRGRKRIPPQELRTLGIGFKKVPRPA